MIHIPVLRWGEPYKSLDVDKVVHFDTGETVCEASRANAALVARDMRFSQRARDVLREVPIRDILGMVKKAADLYTDGDLPLGEGTQSPDQFVRMQSATTGLPEHMCRFNMKKNHFVLSGMDKILDSLTRGLDLDILSKGFGVESRGSRELPGSVARAGHGPAEQLARGSHALAAHHPHADRPGSQTRTAGALDSLSHGAGIHPGWYSPASHRHLSWTGRHRRGRASALPEKPDFRRHCHRGAVQGQPPRSGARSGFQQDHPGRRRRR